MANINISARQKQGKTQEMRLMALAIQWERDPRFKEFCRKSWEPEAFQDIENRITKLKEVNAIEARHTIKNAVKYLDISEIDVAAWEKEWYD